MTPNKPNTPPSSITVGPTGDPGFVTDGKADNVPIQAAIDAITPPMPDDLLVAIQVSLPMNNDGKVVVTPQRLKEFIDSYRAKAAMPDTTNTAGSVEELREQVLEVLINEYGQNCNYDALMDIMALIATHTDRQLGLALEQKESEHLRFLAAILYQLGGRLELRKSSFEAVPSEFSISKSDIVPEIDAIILTLDEASLQKEGN